MVDTCSGSKDCKSQWTAQDLRRFTARVINVERRPDPQATERVLRVLPSWSGIEDAIQGYVKDAESKTSYVDGDTTVSVALSRTAFPRIRRGSRLRRDARVLSIVRLPAAGGKDRHQLGRPNSDHGQGIALSE